MTNVKQNRAHLKPIDWLIVMLLLSGCDPHADFTDSSGQPVALDQFAGKPLLINYFAPWCAPCLREITPLNALASEGRIAVVAINYDPATPAALNTLAKHYQIRVPLLIVSANARLPFPPPVALPTSYLLDGQGQLIQTFVGELTPVRIAALTTYALDNPQTIDKTDK
ncbi:MAG: TlpA family protein disulfide reductase [Aeromonas sp.]